MEVFLILRPLGFLTLRSGGCYRGFDGSRAFTPRAAVFHCCVRCVAPRVSDDLFAISCAKKAITFYVLIIQRNGFCLRSVMGFVFGFCHGRKIFVRYTRLAARGATCFVKRTAPGHDQPMGYNPLIHRRAGTVQK